MPQQSRCSNCTTAHRRTMWFRSRRCYTLYMYRFVSCKLNFSVFTVSLENVLLDVKELQRGMELTKREYSMHGHNTMLKEFIAHNESKLKKLQDDAKIAQVKGWFVARCQTLGHVFAFKRDWSTYSAGNESVLLHLTDICAFCSCFCFFLRMLLMRWWNSSARMPKPHRHQSSSLCLCDLLRPTGWVGY